LPWLRQFTQLDFVQKLPAGVNADTGDFDIPADDFKEAAVIAICRINSEATSQHLPDVIAGIGHSWKPVEFLTDSKAYAPMIVAGLEPVLDNTNRFRAVIAAYLILRFEPQHSHALTTLRVRVAQGNLNDRITAARWLWERTGETNDVVALCVEGLASSEGFIGQTAAYTLEKMGPQAQLAVSALKAALWNKDRFVRERAGKALRKIAPDEMPQIN